MIKRIFVLSKMNDERKTRKLIKHATISRLFYALNSPHSIFHFTYIFTSLFLIHMHLHLVLRTFNKVPWKTVVVQVISASICQTFISHWLVVRCYGFMLRCSDLFPPHWITNCPKSYFRGDGVLCSAPGCVSMFILWFLDVSQGTDVFLGFWPFGNALCKAVVSIDYYNMFTSTFTLTVMSMDRYVAVCHPVKALDMRTPHKAKVKKKKRNFHFKVRYAPFQNPSHLLYSPWSDRWHQIRRHQSLQLTSGIVVRSWNVAGIKLGSIKHENKMTPAMSYSSSDVNI